MSGASGDMTTGTCPICHRLLGVVNPPRGDGSVRIMRPHGSPRCLGSRRESIEWNSRDDAEAGHAQA